MASQKIVTGLDIGTNSLKALVARKSGTGWEALAFAKLPSFGLRKGAVVNPDQISQNIQQLTAQIERSFPRKINSAFVNIGGSHLYTTLSDGIISVSRADHVISPEDVERVLQAARAINMPLNEEILDVFPREFIIDEQKGIKQPVGLRGIRLEAKVVLLCYFQSYFMNLTQAVLNAKLQIEDIIPSSLAAAKAVLTDQQKEMGVALIDIGAATTSLAVFEEGDLIHLAVLPLGSDNITNDLAIGLKIEVAIAEDIKKQHGSCMNVQANEEKSAKTIQVSGNPLSFTKKNLVAIIGPRVLEILDLMQKELKKIGRQQLLPGGIVLTGGGANLPHIKDLTKQTLKLPCQIGTIKDIVGFQSEPDLATVAGLVLSSGDSEVGQETGLLKRLKAKVMNIFKVFIP